MTGFEPDDIVIPLVGDEDLEAVAIGISELELRIGMRALAVADGARSCRP